MKQWMKNKDCTSNGVTEPFPIADPDHVDERRAQVGLGPYAEYEARINYSS